MRAWERGARGEGRGARGVKLTPSDASRPSPFALRPSPHDDPPAYGALREGWPLIAGAAALAVPLGALDRRLAWPPLALAAAVAAFFRDPRRTTPADEACLYAAADGIVLAVDEVDEPLFLRDRALRVVTFLTLFDVHVNRSPVAGTLLETRHVAGRYAAAMNLAGSEANERQYLAIEGVCGPVVVVQIAGLLARRIRRWVEPGATLRAGQKLGMIQFGSRTDVLVPRGQASPLVQRGDRVLAGRTPIARYNGPPTRHAGAP